MEISKTIIKYKYLILIAGLLVIGIGWRLIPHLPNFAPIGAIAITAGMIFRWYKAVWIPLSIMIVSDLIIGLYQGFIWTWLSVAILPLAGIILRRLPQIWRIPAGALSASLLFFIVSNFGVWIASGMYSHTLAGLADCYIMALPFLRNTMLSDLVFTGILLSAFEYGSVVIETRRIVIGSTLKPTKSFS